MRGIAYEPPVHPPKNVYPENQHLRNEPSRLILTLLSLLKSNGQDRVYHPPHPSPLSGVSKKKTDS
jgi:hypothetical protein